MNSENPVETVGGMELVGMTKDEFLEFQYNFCPLNLSTNRFVMSICREAVRVHENDVSHRRMLNPNYKADPDERPVIDPVVLLSYIYRPGWKKVHKMTTLERLRKLAEVHGGRFSECARKELERMGKG